MSHQQPGPYGGQQPQPPVGQSGYGCPQQLPDPEGDGRSGRRRGHLRSDVLRLGRPQRSRCVAGVVHRRDPELELLSIDEATELPNTARDESRVEK